MPILQGTEGGRIMVALVQLVAKETDNLGYITYVFKCLEDEMIRQTKYIMCIRYPNWDHRNLTLGEQGFLTYQTVQAGVDTWFDGKKQVPYKYTNVQFMKFVGKPSTGDHKYVM